MKRRLSTIGTLLLVTLCAFVLQGYHPGAEDDGIYLSAIKHRLNPGLYPYNSDFILLQMQATIFDKVVALISSVLHLPAAYTCFVLQLLCIALLLGGCWRIVSFCFASYRACLAGILTIGSILTLSVAGTAVYLSDEHLHPRIVATDAILFAICALQRRKPIQAVLLLITSLLFHPIMGAFGVSFCILYVLTRYVADNNFRLAVQPSRAAVMPGAWLFSPSSAAWKQALQQHSYYLLGSWQWYEWLGAIAPPFLLFLLAKMGRRRGNLPFFHLAATTTLFSVVQLAIALGMLLPTRFLRLTPLQPMRYLHLTFLLMALLTGAALGEYFLRAHAGRWLLVFLPLAAANGYAQRSRYPATVNLELPWSAPANPWLQAFQWIRLNTPEDAVFALDPHYLSLPGEDNHSFRALAERSVLADDMKDAAVTTQVPKLADVWLAQHTQQAGWRTWTRNDFLHLAQTTPVRWVMVEPRQSAGFTCPFRSEVVDVCKIR